MPLTICGLIHSSTLAHSLSQHFDQGLESFRYKFFSDITDLCNYLDQHRHKVDCLILEWEPGLDDLLTYLHHSATILPAVLIGPETEFPPHSKPRYHAAEVILNGALPEQISVALETAFTHYLKLSQACPLPLPPNIALSELAEGERTSRQTVLSERLKERLGYLGVYYKRDAQQFFRHMPPQAKTEFLEELKTDYRQIILEYFRQNSSVNQIMDAFVSKAFFADISVSQILEIHIELMDNFAKQLKLEGRKEDLLLDYRLTLIDVIAHLCEMYRRSIPREA